MFDSHLICQECQATDMHMWTDEFFKTTPVLARHARKQRLCLGHAKELEEGSPEGAYEFKVFVPFRH